MKKFILVFLTVTAFSCTRTEEAERQAVQDVVHGILIADNRADIDQVLSFYDKEAVLMPAGKPEIMGTQAIRDNYEKIFATSSLNLSAEILSIEISDQLAHCKGRTRGQITVKADSTKIEVNDTFLMTLVRKRGKWRIVRLMWGKDKGSDSGENPH